MKRSIFLFIAIISSLTAKATVIDIPATYPSIQTGIDSSSNGDTILVQPGIYIENINYTGKNVTVASLYLITGDTSYVYNTIIDDSGFNLSGTYGSVVTFHTNENSLAQLIGFLITNGSGNAWFVMGIPARYGGGVFVQNANPTIHHLRLIHKKGGIGGNLILPGAGEVVAFVKSDHWF
jgi:uncharacterized ion transporter superfamily protein YfcC